MYYLLKTYRMLFPGPQLQIVIVNMVNTKSAQERAARVRACTGRVTIFSTGGKVHSVSNFTKLHALTRAALM